MIQIYSPSNTDYTHNGDCVLMPTRCEITAEVNGAWSLQLEHPIDDDGRWRYIEENAVLKVPTWMVNKLQRYRIREVEKTDSMITATAYPVFFDSRDDAYIFDIRISNKTGQQALTQLLTAAPAKYSASSDLIGRQSEVFQNCNLLEAITGPFHDRWGGEILYDNNLVVVNQTIGGDYGVTVEYGKNITGVNYTVDTTDMATRIIPYAYNGRQMSGASPWVDSSLVATYPKVFIRAMQFDDIKLAEDASDDDLTDDSITVCQTQADLDTALTAAVNRQYSVENLDKPKISMSIDLASLEDTDEYRDFSSLEEIRLGDTVHCKHSKLGIVTDASVVSITWDCARDRIAAVVLGDFAFDFVRDSGLDEIRMGIEQMAANLNADGSLMAERIKGLLDGMVCQLGAQYTVAKRQDVMAILFENLDPQSPLYGSLGIGTQGLQISKQRTQDGKGWVWTTVATASGIVADTVVTGTISDKSGYNYWDLDNGHLVVQAFDTNNNETFYLNSNTGEVRINATSFSLAGSTISSMISAAFSNYDPADDLDQTTIFNILTNNSTQQGLWLRDGKLYLNFEYARGQTLKLGGVNNGNGLLEVYNASNQQTGVIDRYGFKSSSYDWFNTFYTRFIEGVLRGYYTSGSSTYQMGEFGFQNISNDSSQRYSIIKNWNCAGTLIQKYSVANGIEEIAEFLKSSIKLNENTTVSGTFKATGATTLSSLTVSGSATFNSGLSSSGITSNGTLSVTGLCGFSGGAQITGGSLVITSGDQREQGGLVQTFSIIASYNIYSGGIVYGTQFQQISDVRLKDNIEKCESDIIDDLDVVSFDWKKDGRHVSSGFIAQDVQEICPELVETDVNGMLTINYTGVIPHLVHKVQQQQKEIDSLKAEIVKIKAILKGVCK